MWAALIAAGCVLVIVALLSGWFGPLGPWGLLGVLLLAIIYSAEFVPLIRRLRRRT